MTRSLLADAYGHHVWATLTLLDVCLELDDKQLATDVPGTYGSILAIARHTVGADYGYLYALTGGTYPEIDEDSMSMADSARGDGAKRAGVDRATGTGARPGHSTSSGTATTTRRRTPRWASGSPRSSTTARIIEARSARR